MEHVFDPLKNAIDIFGLFSINIYSLAILTGIAIATILGMKEAKRLGIDPDMITDGVIIIVPLSIIGARIHYILFSWDTFKNNLPLIFGFDNGHFVGLSGLAIHGGFIVAIISTIVFCKVRKMDFWSITDLVAPGFLVAQAAGRWGNFFNQEAHGGVIGGLLQNGNVALSLDEQRSFLSNTLHLPKFITNQMYLYGDHGLNYYHPTFLYESIWNLIGFAIIMVLRRTKLTRKGDFIFFYLAWYGFGRYFIESMRTDALLVGSSGIRIAQVISIVMFVGGVAGLLLNYFYFKREKYWHILDRVKRNVEE